MMCEFTATDVVDGSPIEYRAEGIADSINSIGGGRWVICNERGQYRRGPLGGHRKFCSAQAAMRALCHERNRDGKPAYR